MDPNSSPITTRDRRGIYESIRNGPATGKHAAHGCVCSGVAVTITEMSPRDRPREKLERSGPSALGDNELLAIILGEGVRHCNALELANEVLAEVGGLGALAQASRDQLCRRRGVGSTRAGRIMAAVELGRRTMLAVPRDARLRITSPRDVFELLAPEFGARRVELFGILLLDVKHRVLRTLLLTTGTSDGCFVDPRQVFREAVAGDAHAVVAFHNHPSGDPTPSSEDLVLTQRLQAAGDLIGVELLDHVIITNDRYYSFKGPLPLPVAEPVWKRRRIAE